MSAPTLEAAVLLRDVSLWRDAVRSGETVFGGDLFARAPPYFVVRLFRRGILSLSSHGEAVMRRCALLPRRGRLVRYLHARSVPLPYFAPFGNVEAFSAVISVHPASAAAARDGEGMSILDRALFFDLLPLDRVLSVALPLGLRFTSAALDIIVSRGGRRSASQNVAEAARAMGEDAFDGGDRSLRRCVTDLAHAILRQHRLVLLWWKWVDVASVPAEHAAEAFSRLLLCGMEAEARVLMRRASFWEDVGREGAQRVVRACVSRCVEGWLVSSSALPAVALAAVLRCGASVRGAARQLMDEAVWREVMQALPPPPHRYPALDSVEGLETWLAAGWSPRFLLSVSPRCRRNVRGRNVGLIALSAMVRTRKARGAEDGEDVELGCGLRTARDGIRSYAWRTKVLPLVFRLSLPAAASPWTAEGRGKWR